MVSRLLSAIAARRGCILAPLSPEWQSRRRFIADTRRKTELLLTDPAALCLVACVRAARSLAGEFAEAGVLKGGSARLICQEKGDVPLHLFDVFESLQASAVAGGEEVREHFGSIHGSQTKVAKLLSSYSNVHIHAGIFPESTSGLETLRFSFVHLDLDLPGSTRDALEYFYPRLVSGGILIGDDYCERYAKHCFDSWFAGRPDTLVELPWSQLMVIRGGAADQLPTVNDPRMGECRMQ